MARKNKSGISQMERRRRNFYALGQRRCAYCGVQLHWRPDYSSPRCDKNAATVEHLVPKSHGGTYHDFNTVCICKRCNDRRNNDNLIEFLNERNIPKKEYFIRKYIRAIQHYLYDKEFNLKRGYPNRKTPKSLIPQKIIEDYTKHEHLI